LAFDCRRETKLPKHACPLPRRSQPNEPRTCPSDRHGRIQLLQKSCPSPLWASLLLRPSHQDACERSHCQGRAKSSDRRCVAIGREVRDSEDSSKLNTSFVERLNLTIRQGSAYLSRRTICQARWKDC